LEVPLYFNFFHGGGLNSGLGTGNKSILEWPSKPSCAASRFVVTDVAINVQGGLFSMLCIKLEITL
jgi:hypothetical protein